ncbi:orexin receptor type 2-like [Homarus americanus]|uniref:orexin receptor type 2-like n=1 Tax=Homarus americanus TaxID=6706 RepID=UPI001C452C41|nr:orexin receptor type 2-like [Homarus americanus]XP_042235945.1 orexin receptor type 2-like [Homarus americanus]XP_042235946.1 orexin receptor type 2-like [Homarus americanus]
MGVWMLEAMTYFHLTTTTATSEVWSDVSSTLPTYLSPQVQSVNESLAFALNVTCHNDRKLVDLTEFEYAYRKETWIPITWREVIKIVAYVIVFMVSLVGNLLVILVVYYNVHMRSSTNQYLVNLAVADLLVTLLCTWVHLVRNLSHPHHVLPAIFCKLDGFAQATSLLASVLTLTVISVGRFVAVIFPLHARTSPDRAHRVIAVVWVTSALLSCPTLFYRELYSIKWANFTSWHCDEVWPNEVKYDPVVRRCVTTYDPKKLFYIILNTAFYFLPVGIMVISYSLVVWRLWMTQLPGEHCVPARNTATRAKKKVVKMVSVVLLVFVLCWTPLQTIILYSNFVHVDHNSLPEWFGVMEFSAYFIALSNSALNPIIYCGFNDNFRKGLMSLLTCRHSSTGRIHHRLHWRGTTGRTRETTVGCSGPEPAVVLEIKSLEINSSSHKSYKKSSHSSRVVMTSYKELRHNKLDDIETDHTFKNHSGGGESSQKGDGCPRITTSTPCNNHCVCLGGDLAEHQRPSGHHHLTEHHHSAPASASSRGRSRVATCCGCCRSTKSASFTLYDVNKLKGNINTDTKEDRV